MTVQISFELPEEVFSALRAPPDQFVRRMRLAAAAKWYELGLLSQGKAAEVAGQNRQEFLETLNELRVSLFQVTADELARESQP